MALRPTKQKEISDIGLSAAIAASGFPFKLENRGGRFLFIFEGDLATIERLQTDFFSGSLRLPARDVVVHLKNLKDAIFAAKRQGGY